MMKASVVKRMHRELRIVFLLLAVGLVSLQSHTKIAKRTVDWEVMNTTFYQIRQQENTASDNKGLQQHRISTQALTCPGYNNPEKLNGKPSWYWIRTMKTATTSVWRRLLTLRETLALSSTGASWKHTDCNCSGLAGNVDFHPLIAQHVGYRPCAEKLLRGYEHGNFVIFMSFRHPVERIVSAWKYGIDQGIAERYQHPGFCKDTNTFLEYLQECPEATDNHYLQMLDPDHMNINTAMQRLDRALILLQSDMKSSMELFKSIVIDPAVPGNKFDTNIAHLNAASNKKNKTEVMPLKDLAEIQRLLDERLKFDWMLYERAQELFAFQNTTCRISS